MRLSITLTPSNTPSNTATFTPTGTQCPTYTPTSTITATPTFTPTQTQTNTPTPDVTTTPTNTNTPTNTETPTQTATNTPSPEVSTTPTNTQTQTPTNTNTPSQTGTPNEVCPNEVTVYAKTGAFLLPALTYTRLTSYIGGGFTGGYFSTPSNIFTTGTAPNGYTYAIFGAQSGSSYYTLIFNIAGSSQRFSIYVSNTDYIINGGTITQTQLLSTSSGGTDIAGVRFVNPGVTNTGWAWVEYPIACPTPTSTATPTQTPSNTQTNTPTPSITPSYTPTQTQTPTTYVDPCLWNTNTDLWNAAAYNWDASCIQPSNTPTVTQTSTPTMTQTQTQTPSGEIICPQELYFENLSIFDYPSGTFTRQTTYTGGTFDYGYLDFSLNIFYPTTAPDGNNYAIFEFLSAGTYYNIMTAFDTGSTPSFIGWVLVEGFSGNTILNGPEYFTSALGLSTMTGTSINGIYFPDAGIQNYYGEDNGNITYSVICPTPTATASATPTKTPTPSNTPTGTPPVVCNTNWLIRNADCGFGTINDIGINGSFMGTLSGPSTFPLTSTLYGTKSNPNGVICGASNMIQANVTTNLPGVGNCARMEVWINSVLTYYTYFDSNPFPQVSGVVINNGDNVEVRISCFSGACPTPSPSNVTPTPTTTPTNTPTQTPTPTIPFTACASLTVRTDASLDVNITGVEVSSVPVTYLSGATFPIETTDTPGYFNTTQTGSTQTVTVTYGPCIAGQHIDLTDCSSNTQCCNLNPGGGTCTFTNVDLSCNCNWDITGYDGTC